VSVENPLFQSWAKSNCRKVYKYELEYSILERVKPEYEKNKITNMSKSTLNRYRKEAINGNKTSSFIHRQDRLYTWLLEALKLLPQN